MTEASKSSPLYNQAYAARTSRWVMLCVMLGTGTVSLNNSSFNPALVELMNDFQIGASTVSWVMVIFLLCMSLSLLLTGFLSQRFGKRKVYLSALAVFVLSSATGIIANHFSTVLLLRALQGFASGLMIPLSLGLIFAVTPEKKRGAATGLWGAMIMLTLACGPMLGVVILLYWHWQFLFLVNVPFGIAALLMGWFYLPKQASSSTVVFDWSGFLLLSGAIVSVLIFLSQIKHLNDVYLAQNDLLLAVTVVCASAFIWRSRKVKNGLIAWQLFHSRGFNYSLIISVVHTVGLFISLLLIPLLVQANLKQSPIWTGVLLMSSALSTSLCSKWAGQALDRYGANGLIPFGMCLTAIAFVGLAFSSAQSMPYLMVCMLLHGLGFGLSYMPSTTAGLNSLEDQDLVTQGAAMNNLLRRLFSAVMVVLAALYLEIRTNTLLPTFSRAVAQRSAIGELFFMCAILLLLALPYAWRFPSSKPNTLYRKS